MGVLKTSSAYITDEQTLAEAVREQVAAMDKQSTVAASDNKYAVRLRRTTKGLENADGLKLNFKVYITTDVNAFACPDGSVRVYSALMDALTDNELLGVLGHEIGHVALCHSLKAWKEQCYRGAVSDTYAAISDSSIGSLADAALSARFSQRQESETDDYGYTFLKRSGKNTWAMVLMFKKLDSLSEKTSADSAAYKKLAQWLQVFSSHPDYDERISRMTARAKSYGKTFHIPAPKGFFTVDTALVGALRQQDIIAADADDAAISNSVNDAKREAMKMDYRIYVGNSGCNYYFLKSKTGSVAKNPYSHSATCSQARRRK